MIGSSGSRIGSADASWTSRCIVPPSFDGRPPKADRRVRYPTPARGRLALVARVGQGLAGSMRLRTDLALDAKVFERRYARPSAAPNVVEVEADVIRPHHLVLPELPVT